MVAGSDSSGVVFGGFAFVQLPYRDNKKTYCPSVRIINKPSMEWRYGYAMHIFTSQAARETGLNPGTPVVICAGDVAVAQSGAGANQEGKVHLCIGTATWIGVSTSNFRNDPIKPFWGLNHIDPQKFIIAGQCMLVIGR